MDIELYKKLLSYRSHSKSVVQQEFRLWLEQYILTNIQGTSSVTDTYGNLYITKGSQNGTVNCVIAHLDINQSVVDDVSIICTDKWILGLNNTTGLQCGLGHDDKTGVYFALQALEKFDNIKVFFPLDEEIGCVGTNECNVDFFDNVGFMVQLDRCGSGDISQYTNGIDVVDDKTKELLATTLYTYGYKWEDCMCTDVGDLVSILEIQGVNISCGYYNEHSAKEILNIQEYKNAENFAIDVLRVMEGTVHSIEVVSYYGYGKHTNCYQDTYEEYGYEDSYLGLTDTELKTKYKNEIQNLVTNTATPTQRIISLIDQYLQDIESSEYYYQLYYPQTKIMLEDYMLQMEDCLSHEVKNDLNF